MSNELWIILLAIALPLIQQLLQALRRRDQLPPQQAERQTAPPPLARTEPPAIRVPVAPRYPAVDAARIQESTVIPPPAGLLRRKRRFARLHDTAELRRAIVLMTILEPCRAMDQQKLPKHS